MSKIRSSGTSKSSSIVPLSCQFPSKILKYSVCSASSFSANYLPENILSDNPNDQSSRWSSESNHPPQYLILKLERPAIVEKITFGKYEKNHVCNLKKFKVYGGMNESHQSIDLLDAGLKNDTIPETFVLKHRLQPNSPQPFPCRYIKILPIQSWGPSFNFSIWFIELKGYDDRLLVSSSFKNLIEVREKEAIRLCLKHFRQKNYFEAFESLQKRTKVDLESKIASNLHDILVQQGDFDGAEHLLEQAALDTDPGGHVDTCNSGGGIFSEYLRRQEYKARWTCINPKMMNVGMSGTSATGLHVDEMQQGSSSSSAATTPTDSPNKTLFSSAPYKPGVRGGHQMVIDSLDQNIYLFGGWDGSNTSRVNGPSARSCHKMCIDVIRKKIFSIGRYLDQSYRSDSTKLKSDFYVYDICSNEWQLITDDTEAMGGPKLIFDHQVCFDSEENTIWLFGGRILTPVPSNHHHMFPMVISVGSSGSNMEAGQPADPAASSTASHTNHTSHNIIFSGLYAYHVATNSWKCLRPDSSLSTGLGSSGIMSSSTSTLFSSDYGPATGASSYNQGPSSSSTLKPLNHDDLKSRIGHSMLFHEKKRILYIFGGQRSKEYLSDLVAYDVDNDCVQIIYDGIDSEVPASGFTQRATIDFETNEMFVLSGINKERKEENVKNSFWIFDMIQDRWSCVYTSSFDDNAPTGVVLSSGSSGSTKCSSCRHNSATDNNNSSHHLMVTSTNVGISTLSSSTSGISFGQMDSMSSGSCPSCRSAGHTEVMMSGPKPRYAHQLVYDQKERVHYLFGGNPGQKFGKVRLDDFWSLRLDRMSVPQLLRRCRRMIRETHFKEIISTNPIQAVKYLQTKLSETFDHMDPVERVQFQELASQIFKGSTSTGVVDYDDDDEDSAIMSSLVLMATSSSETMSCSDNVSCDENPSSCDASLDSTTAADSLIFRNRTKVFDSLIEFFPEEMIQPKSNLLELINL